MFDLITGKATHMPKGGGIAAMLTGAVHMGVLSGIVVVPLLFVTNTLPTVPAMMAFVSAVPPPVPPAPPPPPAARATPTAEKVEANPEAAPVEAPNHIAAEPIRPPRDDEHGGAGGVEGGIAGGVAGGIVAGVADPPAPPPPPPSSAVAAGPVRIGGDIHPPALLQRVEPTYPELALRAHVEGTVILEAIIDESGAVQSLKTLRSIALLDQAAMAAVAQWRYSPVILNGRPVPVILTVVLTFKIPRT